MLIADFHSDYLTSDSFNGTFPFGETEVVFAVFRGKRDFKTSVELSKKAKIIAYEDVGYEDLDIDALIASKPVYVGLTWNGENRFGYGCNYKYGLKKDGLDLISKLNGAGIAVDVAHISEGGFNDIIDRAETVVDSHTCFNGVYAHKRNLSDRQIDLLVERNAPIGVTLCGYFMSEGVCKTEDFIREIDYYCSRHGTDNLCVGTDFYGADKFPEGISDYNDFYLVVNALIKRGYSSEDIEKIFYGNLHSFLEKRNGKRL